MANIQNDGAGVLSAPQNKEKSSGFARWIKKWNGHPFSALTELLVWLSGIAMMLIMLFLVGFISCAWNRSSLAGAVLFHL